MPIKTVINKTVLPNGIRVLSESVPYVDSVSVGIWVDSGSRDENAASKGIHHFIEHMLFKGTEKRSARQIADEMEILGGHLNAFTDRETTGYYARVLSEHMATAIDILCDMVLHSKHDPVELARERNVVVEEIKRHEDTPEDMIHDVFAQALWPNHPLGNFIAGDRKTVSRFTQETVVEHVARDYRPGRIVVSAAGNLRHDDLVALISQYMGDMDGGTPERVLYPAESSGTVQMIAKRSEQVHLCLGTPGYSQENHDKFVLAVLDGVIGGGMSSRLFQEVRENRGLVYNIGSYSGSFREAGMFSVYAGTSVENMDEVIGIIEKELENVKTEPVGAEELQRGQNQIRGALVLGQESMSNRMSRMATSEIYHGRIIPVQEVIDAIMKVTAEDMMRVANELFVKENVCLTAIGPFKRGRKAA
jgi:predicted Zn-dependent peptidase